NSKCFIWCRLGISKPLFLSLSCPEVVPRSFSGHVSRRGYRGHLACPQPSPQGKHFGKLSKKPALADIGAKRVANLWHAGRFQNSCVPRRAPILTFALRV